MSRENILKLDPLVHAPKRLAILSILISAESADFSFLKKSVNASDGNLSTHLTKLEQNGYIEIQKTFIGKKPHTRCMITPKGREAFIRYLDTMEKIVISQRRKHE